MKRLTRRGHRLSPERESGARRTKKGVSHGGCWHRRAQRESQICVLTEDGELIERRIRTEVPRFAEVLSERPHARILIEAGTESEWVARCLERLGHEVI